MIMNGDDEDAALKDKAHILIEAVIKDAKEHLRELREKEREAEYVIQNIQWTLCKDFTVERGQQQIEEYVAEEELKYSKRYHYRVRWSIPTCRKPIPRTTACVYFIIEISKIKPPLLGCTTMVQTSAVRLYPKAIPCQLRYSSFWNQTDLFTDQDSVGLEKSGSKTSLKAKGFSWTA
ncbi:A-kinase anchor protein 14 isoform X2 [Carettochelys insculpta]|uniref:A-kinase anchor protein 14 isoform X2 n=1 Tax=Carettochelys insculpta TaxID=44489 RepID=UPI003EB83B1B